MAATVAMATVSIIRRRARLSPSSNGAFLPATVDAMASQAEHRVPFLVECVAGSDEDIHLLGRRQQLVVRQALAARHRRRILAHGAVIQVRIGLLMVLPTQRHLP